MAFSTHDQVPDSPTNVFATLNSLPPSSISLSDGNMTLVTPNASTNNLFSTISFPNEGKWFFEILYISYQHHYSGIFNKTTGDIYQIYQQTFYTNGASSATLSTNSYSASSNSVIGLLINFENVQATVTIYINGTSVGGPYNITSGEYFAVFNDGASATGGTQIINFGQDHLFGGATLPSGAGSNTPDNGIGTFAFSVPTGALALCTANLPDPDIDPAVDDLPEDYFKAVKYTGQTTVDAGTWDNVNSRSTIAVGFQADLLWLKGRNYGEHHALVDSVRGASSLLQSNRVNGESATTQHVLSIGSTNFTIGTNHEVNNANSTFVAWCWKAGGAPNLTSSPTKPFAKDNVQYETLSAAGITAGTITPTAMSVNTKAGLSIVKWQASNGSDKTVPHGLSNSLDMIIMKNLDTGTYGWHTSHIGLTTNHNLLLNTSDQSWNAVTGGWVEIGTGSVFNIKNGTSGTNTNNGTDNYIAYCWHSVAGYSAFGSYTGNGSADGPFVYTGFKPAWVMIKSSTYATTTYTSWAIYDNARETYNPNNNVLYANKSINEGYRGNATTAATDIDVDFLSNGFKVRSDKAEINQDTETYIYAAFAEQPFKYANAR